MGAAIPYTSSRAPAAALGFFQAFFFAVCLVVPLAANPNPNPNPKPNPNPSPKPNPNPDQVPLLWLLLLALLWLVPLHAATQHRLLVAAEIAHAWSALDVFLLTLVASLLELDQFSQFIVGSECDGVNRLLSRYFSPLVSGEPRCFVVDAQLEPGVWLLFAASLVSMASGHLVMHGGARALSDHERRSGRAERDAPPPIWPNPIALGGAHGGAPAPALLGAPLLPS